MEELQKLQAEAESRMQYKPVENKTMADAMREKLKGIEQVEPNQFAESNAYKKYFSTKQDILEEAKTINKATGIPVNAIIDGNVEKAREIYDYQRKQLDPEEVYKTYPGLKKLAELDETEAAIALHDLKSVKKTHDIFEAAKVGHQTQSLDYEKRAIGLKAFEGTYTDEDRKRVAEIEKELSGLKEIPDLMEAPGQNIVGGLFQQVPMMVRQLVKGQVLGVAGAAVGGAIGAVGGGLLTGGSASPALGLQGARIGYSLGSRVGFATEMFKESVGGYYLDYIGYKDKRGNQLLSDGEARVYATVTALAETGIEMANFGKVLEILKGNKATVPAAKVVENIVKNSKDAASLQAQLKTWLSTNMKNIGIVVATESAEEGVQQMSEMGISQIARLNNPEGNIPKYNAEDFLKEGLRASYQALGASIGMGGMAAGASGLRFTRHAAELLSLGKERADEALRTNSGVNLLNNLMEAATGTELGANHKETFNKLMKSNLEGTVHETAFVDSELLLQQEGGDVVFNQLAAAAGYTEEQINTLRETGAPIEINTADVVTQMAGNGEINISEYVSFDAADRCFARNKKVAIELDNLLKKVKTQEVERTIDNINTLVTEMFGETEERDLATMIVAEFQDPVAGIEERRREINREISEMIDPVVEEMRSGMGQGVELYTTDDYGNIIQAGDGAHIGEAVRLSNNAPWYSKYYKANKKRPSEQELRELAEEVITGVNEYGVGDYDYTDPGMIEYAEETKARLENLRHELELLDNIEPKLKEVDKGDFAALDALSEDGIKVYKAIMDKLRNMPNKDVSRSASMGALIYAHRAEVHAQAMRLLGNKKYTALDYMASHPVEFGGEKVKGALGQNDVSPESFYTISVMGNEFGEYKDIKELRKKAKSWYQENLQGTAAYNPVLGKILIDTNLDDVEFKFTGAGRKKMVDNAANPVKMFVVKHLKELTENANYITFADSDGTKHLGERFYFLHVGIDTDKGRNYAIINIRRTKEGEMFYYGHNIFQDQNEYNAQIEKTVQDTSATRVSAPGPEGLTAISNNSIAEENKIFNQQRVFYQSAWHGTPHEFNKFDLGAIGTGEGAQAHGWGLYFAKDKKVARNYREMLSDNYTTYNGKDINELYSDLMRKGEYGKAAIVEEVMTSSVEELRENIDQFIEDEIFSKKDYAWFEKQIAPKLKRSGTLFEVDVPENDVLLDEDLKFDEQPEKVKEAIHNILGDGKMLDEQEYLETLDRQNIRETIGFLTETYLDFKTSYLYDELIEDLGAIASALYNGENAYEARDKITSELKEQLGVWVEENGIDKDVDFVIEQIHEVIGNEIIKHLMEYRAQDYSEMTGYELYNRIIDVTGGPKQASMLLNENGVKGITYVGERDGRCFVVFDDKAIAIINRFNQAAGQNAETANLAALDEAMQMYEEDQDAKTIYEKTGWYRGADGKWRFDIPDNFDEINLEEIPEEGRIVNLEALYDNPALYEAYPWLKTTWVYVNQLGEGIRGSADYANDIINISPALVKKGKRESIVIGKERFIRAKTDENIEQWQPLTGKTLSDTELMAVAIIMANEDNVDKAIEETRADIAKSIESVKFNEEHRPNSWFLEKVKQNLKEYEEILSSLEKIKKEGFEHFSYDFTDEKKTREELGKTLVHEIQHMIQAKEGFAGGGNVGQVHWQMRRQIDNYRRRAREIDQNAFPYYNAQRDWEAAIIMGEDPEKIQELQKNLRFLEELVPEENRQPIIDLLDKASTLERQLKTSMNPVVDYYNLHGEQEARAASRKAETNTEIERAKKIEIKSIDEILASHIDKVAPENQEALREWVELMKIFEEAEDFQKILDRQKVLENQLESDAAAQAFFDEWGDNDELEWQKLDLSRLEKAYTKEVLEGVNPYNAIIVFSGDVIAGYSVGPKGQTIVKSTGERVIKLFETADESTFIHEMAHVAYEDLRELASYANAPAQFKRDIKTLDDWANWKEGQLDEYVGTASYQEFAQRDAAIRKALASGDNVTAEELKYEWRQERFARGFEEYLKKGKAPTEGLRRVFYQFKNWLTKIYRAYRGIGGVPTKEVEAVMTRLLLTEEAIELAEKKAEIDAFEKSGVFNYLGDNAKAMWQKILEDVRKDATSKVLKIAMKDMSELAQRERQDKIEAERQAAYERMAKEPVWTVYSYLKNNPEMDTLAACKLFGLTIKEYVNLLKANGGSLERAVENYMVNYIRELEAPKKAEIEAKAEEAMSSGYYKTLLSALEVELLQREVRREARLSKKIAAIEAKDETERAEIERTLRELDKKGDEAKAQRALRDVAVGNAETIRQYAKSKLATMNIAYSANPTVWKNASRQKAAEMTEALAKKEYGKAVHASKMRLVYDAMTDLATENKRLVDRKSKQMRDRAKTIRREKNMGANDRYVYNHLLYAFGLAERDVPKPPDFTTFNEVLISYDSTLSMPFIGDNGELLVSDFIINAGTGTGKAVKGIFELTVSEFTELANVMDNIYTVAVEANKIKTVKTTEGETITIDRAIAEITDDAFKRHKEKEVTDTTMAGNIKKMDEVLNVANRAHVSVLKIETILGEICPTATKYIYDPLKRATDEELKMTVEFGERIERIREAWRDGKIEKYLNKGMSDDEAKKAADKEIEETFTAEKYKLGTSTITKENIIAFALNWGTEINRKRAMNYQGTTQRDFERIFAEMDSADWQFVTNVWDLFEDTWPQLKAVEASVSGVTLEKQEGITFNVTDKEGATYIIQGKYYPIKYDPKKTQKVERYQKEEGVRTNLPSMARMGIGIGMTKERAVSTSYLMRNDLGVFAEAIQENIHLICMREAVRDASRIINDDRFADLVKNTLGNNAYSALQDWVLDCWQLEPKVKNDFESVMAYLRRKQTTAVLAFRLSTALFNFANLGPMVDYLGAARTTKALWDFYGHKEDQTNFVIERSPFVKNRAQTMDRDMRDVVKGKGVGDKMNKLEAMGFYMITKTDLMLACPLWLSEYQRVYRENAEKLSADQIERLAVDAGDKAVRTVFGSGLTLDLAAVQRGGEVTKMLTMYYSYFSVVQQAISKSAFEYNRRKVNGDEWYKRWAPVANTLVYWVILPAAITTAFKMGIEALTGDDDDEITFENFIKRTVAESINAAAGGVPILRDVVNMAMAYAVEGKYYGARSTSIGETTEKMMDVIRSIKGFAEDKKDLDDVLRAVFRATAYTTGLPVAGADAMATLYQWIAYGDATPEEIREYMTAILFDKKVKK